MVPSKLSDAPTGRTKLVISASTPQSSCRQAMLTGRVAAEEPVPKIVPRILVRCLPKKILAFTSQITLIVPP